MVLKHADQLQVDDQVKIFAWRGASTITGIEPPHHPHFASRDLQVRKRLCVRLQFDSLSWHLYDTTDEFEVL